MDFFLMNEYVIRERRKDQLRAAEQYRLVSKIARRVRLPRVAGLKNLLYLFL
jgi:hypothetical protein